MDVLKKIPVREQDPKSIRRIMEFPNFMTASTNRTLGVLDHNTGHVDRKSVV